MNIIEIAGLKVDAIAKKELLEVLRQRINRGQKTWITTLYSEFLYAALRDRKVLNMLNQADIAVTDGIGMMWAAKYLSIPLNVKNYWLKIIQAVWQANYSLAAIIFRPEWIKRINLTPTTPSRSNRNSPPFKGGEAPQLSVDHHVSPPDKGEYLAQRGEGVGVWEKIVGADLIWDLAKLAAENNLSIYPLGGFGDTPNIVSDKLISQYPNIAISGCSSKNPNDPTVIDDIQKASPDLLFVAYGPIKQETWIAQNLPNLPVKLAIGLGGTFDYLAGKQPIPPKFMRYNGLEWLYRLFTQPRRLKRIFQATFGLVWNLMKYKIFSNLPYRQNAVSVVMNRNYEIFIAKFNPEKKVLKALGYSKKKFEDYWQLPQGGIEENEDLAEGAKRELWEETAMRNIELVKISDKKHSYFWKDISQRPLLVGKRFQYKGQEQSIVYFRFTGPEKEIVLDWDELVEYKWVKPDDLNKALHEEKQPLARLVQGDLKEMREKGII